MTKRKTPKANETAHITIRCNNKKFLFNLQNNYSDIVSWLNTLPYFYSVSIHHVLFMSNHIHLLVTPNENNFGNAMCYFLTNLAKFLNFQNKRINHVFGSRYQPTIISHKKHLANVVRYLYQNPLRAGICKNIFEYPYSSLHQYLGIFNHGICLENDYFTKQNFENGLNGRENWIKFISKDLNTSDSNLIKKSLTRSYFKFSHRQHQELIRQPTTLII